MLPKPNGKMSKYGSHLSVPNIAISKYSSESSSSKRSLLLSITPPNTPKSPITPNYNISAKQSSTPNTQIDTTESNDNVFITPYLPQDTMYKFGYLPIIKIADTLQGSVWKVKSKSNKICIIKVTSIALTEENVACLNGQRVHVQENILKEASILKHLTKLNPPKSLAKYIGIFKDDSNYFLIIQYGGSGLFEFIQKCHQLIEDNLLSMREWHRFCKKAIKQMVEIIDWIHQMNCAHLDLSLENFAIGTVLVEENSRSEIHFIGNFQIKLIDFGLAEVFRPDKNGLISFKCRKYVGKKYYKAPNVHNKQEFNAICADIWSFGVCLVSMVTGVTLYEAPNKNDMAFQYVISGRLYELLKQYSRAQYVNDTILDLMLKIFVYEKLRINMREITNHYWLKY